MATLDMNPYTHRRKIHPKESKEDLGDNWSVFYHKFKIMAMSLVFCVSDSHMHNRSAMHCTCQIYHVGQEHDVSGASQTGSLCPAAAGSGLLDFHSSSLSYCSPCLLGIQKCRK